MMKCDIELGSRGGGCLSTFWWWEIHPRRAGCNITGDNTSYASCSAALRNARTWAKLLGFTVVKVSTYGAQP